MRRTAALAFAGLLTWTTPGLAQVAPEPDVAAFQRLRAEGVAAANAGDLDTASARLAEADRRIPNHPGLMLMRARLAAASAQPEAALLLVRRYADAGLVANLAGDPSLSALAGEPGFEAVAAAIEANRTPLGADRLRPLATVPGDGLVEGVARDEAGGRWLISKVRGRTIVAIDDAGRETPFLTPHPQIGGMAGLAIDPTRGVLWAAMAPLPPAAHGAGGTPLPPTALIRVSLETGRMEARFDPPKGSAEGAFGDVLLTGDGAVYVSDSATGEIFTVRPAGEKLELVLPAGTLRSPQGMVQTPDGAALIVADYSSGLWRVDRAGGAAIRLQAPASASLIGVDGLISDGQFIYALQNGVAPQRVLKLALNVGWTGIDTVGVLAANLPQIDEPTTGLVQDGELVFVSRSQWSDFDGEGAPRTSSPAPALISRLRLD